MHVIYTITIIVTKCHDISIIIIVLSPTIVFPKFNNTVVTAKK